MGGHGGLNILPQKRWNVYNFENREKVRRDEEAAAREEQLKREQSRKRDAEFRLESLRQARGLAGNPKPNCKPSSSSSPPSSRDANHINLFEGLAGFSSLAGPADEERENRREAEEVDKRKKRRKEEPAKVVGPEDEKYRLGYGLAGKGVKAPWYLSRPPSGGYDERNEDAGSSGSGRAEGEKKKKSGRKTLEELREERNSREKRESDRERELVRANRRKSGEAAAVNGGRSSRWVR